MKQIIIFWYAENEVFSSNSSISPNTIKICGSHKLQLASFSVIDTMKNNVIYRNRYLLVLSYSTKK